MKISNCLVFCFAALVSAGAALAAPPVVGIGNSSLVKPEYSGEDMIFTVNRSGDLSVPVLIGYRTQNDTAIAGWDNDYMAVNSTLLIPEGANSGTVRIPIRPGIVEQSRDFLVNLVGASGPLDPRALGFHRAASGSPSSHGAAVVALDFNHDGLTDVATLDGNIARVSVWISNGSTFLPPAHYGVTGSGPSNPYSPNDMTAADFNRDGHVDLAIVGHEIAILPGRADGSFGPMQAYPGGLGDRVTMTAGDFNGDGWIDIATVAYGSQYVYVHSSTAGSFSLEKMQGYPIGVLAGHLRAADFDLDGRADLVAFGGNKIRVLIANTTGTFWNADTYDGGAATVGPASVLDVNGDGHPDLLAPCTLNSVNNVCVFLHTGDGYFGPATIVPAGDTGMGGTLAIADMNADGRPDLISPFSTGVTWLRNAGAGGYVRGDNYGTDAPPRDIATGDFDGDGDLDVVTAGSYGSMSVLFNLGQGVLAARREYPVGGGQSALVTADFNGDQRPDLAFTQPDSNTVSVLLGAAGSTFMPRVIYPAGTNPSAIAAADLNGDSLPDIAVTTTRQEGQYSYATVSVWLNSGNGNFAPRSDYNTYGVAGSIAAVDRNGDGAIDLVIAGDELVNAGNGTFASRLTYPAGYVGSMVASADFDGDGIKDLVTAQSTYSGQYSFMYSCSRGGGTASTPLPYTRPVSVEAGDFNGDGLADIAVGQDWGSEAGLVEIYFNRGSCSFSVEDGFNVPAFPSALRAADVNGDGQLDTVTLSASRNKVFLGFSAGLTGRGPNEVRAEPVVVQLAAGGGPSGIAVADFTGDGRPDLAVANRYDATLSIFKLSFMPAQVAVGQGVGTILPNGDSNPDAFVFNGQSGVPTRSVRTSDVVTLRGFNKPTDITVAGGSYSLGCWDDGYSSEPGTAYPGQLVCVRHTSASGFFMPTHTTLTVGGVSATFTSVTEEEDRLPEPFTFPAVIKVARSALQVSGEITVAGINSPSPVSVINGAYSKNGAPFTTVAGTVNAGDRMRVQHFSSSAFSSTVTTALTVGATGVLTGVTGRFSSTTAAEDRIPDAFRFADAEVLLPGSQVTSNVVTITGINVPVRVTVNGGEFKIIGVTQWQTTAANISNGQRVQVRHTASLLPTGKVDTVLNIGGVTDTFTSTVVPDLTPDDFRFTDVTGVARNTTITSAAVKLKGFTGAALVQVSGGEYRINSGSWTTNPGVARPGDAVRVRHVSGAAAGAVRNTTLTVGGVSDTFTSTTR